MRSLFIFLLCLPLAAFGKNDLEKKEYDIVIYGGSSAGIVSAIQCARMSCSVVLIVPSQHLGGMTANGLSCVDVTNPSIIGGITSEFFHHIWNYYQNTRNWNWEAPRNIEGQAKKSSVPTKKMWVVEPRVAESIFMRMLAEDKVDVVFNERLVLKNGLYKRSGSIQQIKTETGKIFSGKMFIDATYEGDLLAAAGVSYCIGRESNSQYKEENNGIKPNSALSWKIDPHIIPGNSKSGLLPRIFPDIGGEVGAGDQEIQAYNYRLCLTDHPLNRIFIDKPSNYDEKQYELLFRIVEADNNPKRFMKLTPLPNKKFDLNHSGPVSTDYTGKSRKYAEADYATRSKIALEHKKWQKGLIWTLQNHERIPSNIREFYKNFGLARDEFCDNAFWPYELYVREARRLISSFVMTENIVLGKEKPPHDGVGLASYHIDTHAVKYYRDREGFLQLEGGIFKNVPKPFPISYRSIIPKPSECDNLLVPICISSSHVAYGSIRMEPVFMILGQSAATAAALAVKLHLKLHELPYKLLRIRLLADGQVLKPSA